MICPNCGREMLVIEMNQVEADWCHACGGIWLDDGELELLSETATSESPILLSIKNPIKKPGDRKCPRCGKNMSLAYPDLTPPVELDICNSGDGVWFDKGELEKIVSAIRGEPVADALTSIFKREVQGT